LLPVTTIYKLVSIENAYEFAVASRPELKRLRWIHPNDF